MAEGTVIDGLVGGNVIGGIVIGGLVGGNVVSGMVDSNVRFIGLSVFGSRNQAKGHRLRRSELSGHVSAWAANRFAAAPK